LRADRLLSLLLLLQARGRMTAQELAERLEVSERTIYRDIGALSSAGIPVYTESGPGGGCELVDGYQTKLTGLTTAEVRALFLLSLSGPLADLGLDRALDDALLKLSAALPITARSDAAQVRQRIHMDTTAPDQANRALPYLGLIQEAVWQDRTLQLTYGRYVRQDFEPYGLVSKANVWYLVGTTAGEMQVLRVSRIQAAELTAQRFVRPDTFDLANYWTEWSNRFLAHRSSRPKEKKAIYLFDARSKNKKTNYVDKSQKIKKFRYSNHSARSGISSNIKKIILKHAA